jgi:cell division protein FtsW
MNTKISYLIKGDRGIWVIVFFLFIYSMLSVYSAVGNLAFNKMDGNTTYYLLRQGFLLLAGVGVIYIFHLVPYRYFSGLSVLFFYTSIALLVFTMIWGIDLNEAKRWIMLPGGITIQTSDFAKVALMMYLARTMAHKEKDIQDFKGMFKLLMLPVLITCGLIVKSDISTAALVFAVAFVLMIVGKVKLKYLLSITAAAIVFLLLFFLILQATGTSNRFETAKKRIENFRGGEENVQSKHTKIAVATGGLTGKGPGKSSQRTVLPHSYSDYIFAIIVEEFGLIFGAIPLVVLYLFLFLRSRNIVRKVNRKFGAYVTAGLALMIVLQALANMAVAVDLFPVTGQPLPFVSYGGTSIIFTGMALGIILSVSREIYDKKEDFNEIPPIAPKTDVPNQAHINEKDE